LPEHEAVPYREEELLAEYDEQDTAAPSDS